MVEIIRGWCAVPGSLESLTKLGNLSWKECITMLLIEGRRLLPLAEVMVGDLV